MIIAAMEWGISDNSRYFAVLENVFALLSQKMRPMLMYLLQAGLMAI